MLTQTLIIVAINTCITAIMLWLYEMGRKRWREKYWDEMGEKAAELAVEPSPLYEHLKKEALLEEVKQPKPKVVRNREDLVIEREREKDKDGKL